MELRIIILIMQGFVCLLYYIWRLIGPTHFAGLVTDNVGIFGLLPNLTVICERDVAHLNFSTGGNIVQSLRAAQECTILSTNETIFDQDRYQEVHNNYYYTAHDQKLIVLNRF